MPNGRSIQEMHMRIAHRRYLIWEPSDQYSIQTLIDIYVNTSLEHAPGLRFAINIDPAQARGAV